MVALATGSEATHWVKRKTSFKYVLDAVWGGGREKTSLLCKRRRRLLIRKIWIQ